MALGKRTKKGNKEQAKRDADAPIETGTEKPESNGVKDFPEENEAAIANANEELDIQKMRSQISQRLSALKINPLDREKYLDDVETQLRHIFGHERPNGIFKIMNISITPNLGSITVIASCKIMDQKTYKLRGDSLVYSITLRGLEDWANSGDEDQEETGYEPELQVKTFEEFNEDSILDKLGSDEAQEMILEFIDEIQDLIPDLPIYDILEFVEDLPSEFQDIVRRAAQIDNNEEDMAILAFEAIDTITNNPRFQVLQREVMDSYFVAISIDPELESDIIEAAMPLADLIGMGGLVGPQGARDSVESLKKLENLSEIP